MVIYHIDAARFERIRSQGHKFELTGLRIRTPPYRDGDASYHLIDGERALCSHCGKEFDSLKAETPAELEMEKMKPEGKAA